jgi:hypothetical protein
MDETAIIAYITDTFAGIETVTATSNTFFFYGPERMIPLATLVTNDEYDSVSNLSRPSVYRLNIGVSKATFRALFGSQPTLSAADDDGASGFDFTTLDQVLPHPVYGRMYWVCVLNPSAATFEVAVRPLLAEAYERAVSKYAKRAARSRG